VNSGGSWQLHAADKTSLPWVIEGGSMRSSGRPELLLGDDGVGRLGTDSVLGWMLEPADVGAALALDPALLPATGATVRLDGGWSVLVCGPSA
jgi:3-oxoacyl-[acyl-carrier protein] reductase